MAGVGGIKFVNIGFCQKIERNRIIIFIPFADANAVRCNLKRNMISVDCADDVYSGIPENLNDLVPGNARFRNRVWVATLIALDRNNNVSLLACITPGIFFRIPS